MATQTLSLSARIDLLSLLGQELARNSDSFLKTHQNKIAAANPWFQPRFVAFRLQQIARDLDRSNLEQWLAPYQQLIKRRPTASTQSKIIGLIPAANIPISCFEDWLAIFLSGHKAQVRLPDRDKVLLPALVDYLRDLEPAVSQQTQWVDRIQDPDAVIATGSNNSSRYFTHYFGRYPHIIRKNRNSLAILSGTEKLQELRNLSQDIFLYFGMGCRNVSQLLVPRDWDASPLLQAIEQDWSWLMEMDKYKNNYDYNKTLLLLNRTPHQDNGILVIHEDQSLASPLATLHFQTYHNPSHLQELLDQKKDQVQCVVGHNQVPFGQAQFPALHDYADGADTLEFLLNL